MLNNLGSSQQQSDALMGLALHVVQDYFAHTTKIDVYNYNGKKLYYSNITTTQYSNNILNNTKIFEDNKNVIPWRYTNSKRITYVLYDLYKKNKTIKNISQVYVGNSKKSYTFFKSRNFFKIMTKEYYLKVEY